jgi:hypothetical protein
MSGMGTKKNANLRHIGTLGSGKEDHSSQFLSISVAAWITPKPYSLGVLASG